MWYSQLGLWCYVRSSGRWRSPTLAIAPSDITTAPGLTLKLYPPVVPSLQCRGQQSPASILRTVTSFPCIYAINEAELRISVRRETEKVVGSYKSVYIPSFGFESYLRICSCLFLGLDLNHLLKLSHFWARS
jgi:hypothetical protein